MKDSIGQYLHEIGQVPLLDAARERELAQRIEAGRDAQERLDAGETAVELKRAVRQGARAKDEFIRGDFNNELRKGNTGVYQYWLDFFGPKGLNQPPE